MDLVENKNVESIIKRHPWEYARFKIISSNVKNFFISAGNKKVTIIDIGCGDCFVINKLSKIYSFNEVYAVDIHFTNENIEYLQSENPCINFKTSFNDINILENNHYIILLNDVIEHVEFHLDFLEDINNIIVKNVSILNLYITVPAFQFLFSQHDHNLLHYRRYNVKDLKNYNELLKLNIDNSGYFFFLPYIIRLIQKLIFGKGDKNKIINTNWNHGIVISKIIESMFLIDYKIGSFLKKIKINLPGLSTYIIFSKNKSV
jgi:hypothetical protein